MGPFRSVKRRSREAALSFEPDRIGAWSSRGEFLGLVSETTAPDGVASAPPSDYLHVGRGGVDEGVSATLHRFARGGEEGYRVQVRRWDGSGEESYWIAPTVEDEGYIGMFTEEEARRAFPYLFAAREMPGGFGIF